MQYLFTSARLGFRNWVAEDIPKMAAINADAEVMHYFPSTQSLEHTAGFVQRMQQMFSNKGYCYFAVETLHNGAFIGFIGMAWQTYESPYTPCTDIGWRLSRQVWHNGYATEGAKRCLQYAGEVLQLQKLYAFAPVINQPSVHVMQKLGMQYEGVFIHPQLAGDERLGNCVAYSIMLQ